MRYTTLGRTDLEVSRVCFGTWQFGGDWGSLEERENVAAMRRALELGVNFFDTAQAYGFGASEQLVARALGDELRTGEIVLATKGGLRMEGDRLLRDSSREWLRRGVEDSLRSLGVEHIDLYQVHWPDPGTPFSETAGALQELVEEGKVRHVGVSNFDVSQMTELGDVETLQPPTTCSGARSTASWRAPSRSAARRRRISQPPGPRSSRRTPGSPAAAGPRQACRRRTGPSRSSSALADR